MKSRANDIVCSLAAVLIFGSMAAGWLFIEHADKGAPGAGRTPTDLAGVRLEQPLNDGLLSLSDLSRTRLVLVVAPGDCPSCYELAFSELNRLCYDQEWKGRVVGCVPGPSAEDIFLPILRRRYNLLFPLYYLAPDSCGGLQRQPTPSIFVLDSAFRVQRAALITPSSAPAFSALVDSLWADRKRAIFP